MQTTKHVHLVGIGGAGLSAIARLLLESGVRVSGSDRQLSPLAKALQEAGVQVFVGHRAENVRGASLVVRSSAVPDDNVEVLAARAAGIPVLKRAEFLGQLLSQPAGQRSIAVAGTHGKTTTTAMIAWTLQALGQQPSYLIGGVSTNLGTNAHAGQGRYFVIEADEYDRMFLGLRPAVAVVTNVEHDHPDCYPTAQDFLDAFQAFVDRLQPDGVLLACGDDPGAAGLISHAASAGRKALAYGTTSRELDYAGRNLLAGEAGGYRFDLYCKGRLASPVKARLRVPGVHNVRNALAALGTADVLGLSLAQAAQALEEYSGTGRRFELRGQAAGVAVIDDYAHHPTEIRATLAAARDSYAGRRLWAVWQPHTYSRTRALWNEFLAAFKDADRVLVTEIYAAREDAPADGLSARKLAAQMRHPPAVFAADLAQAKTLLVGQLKPGDVVLVLSAGDADQLSKELLAALGGEPASVQSS